MKREDEGKCSIFFISCWNPNTSISGQCCQFWGIFVHIGHVHSLKLSETFHFECLAPLEHKVINLIYTKLQRLYKMSKKSVPLRWAGVVASRQHHHPSFLPAPFLVYRTSSNGLIVVVSVLRKVNLLLQIKFSLECPSDVHLNLSTQVFLHHQNATAHDQDRNCNSVVISK